MSRFLPILLFTGVILLGCQDYPTDSGAAKAVPPLTAALDHNSCGNRSNNTVAKLTECVTLDGVRAHQAAFQAIADANGGVRSSGTPGYDQSASYVAALLSNAGYNVTLQPFTVPVYRQLGPATLSSLTPVALTFVDGADFQIFTESPGGDVTAPVYAVDLMFGLGNSSTSGCEAADFAGFPPGSIALLQRGTCTFQVKALNAEAAGAVGAIIFNQGNTDTRVGLINGTLGSDHVGTIPVFAATYDLGALLESLAGLVARMAVDVFDGDITTANVIAETPGGRADNVVMAGAHLDSNDRGPGIQDNGSGSAALLEVALQMTRVQPQNKLRLAWWAATELGGRGSNHYVNGLSATDRSAIALYLNFDMIGSPNFVNFVSDGDGSSFGSPGPTGSAAIESFFQNFYASRGLPSEPTQVGRFDESRFSNAGIPVGGIFSGAEDIKTPAEAAVYGGTAGDQYDPCYHLACDTFDNVSLQALDVNSDAVAASVLQYAQSTEAVNGINGKGNFNSPAVGAPGQNRTAPNH